MFRWFDQWMCGLAGHDYVKDWSRGDGAVMRLHCRCLKCGAWSAGWTWERGTR